MSGNCSNSDVPAGLSYRWALIVWLSTMMLMGVLVALVTDSPVLVVGCSDSAELHAGSMTQQAATSSAEMPRRIMSC
ncbi:MAG: hypothetical protein Q4A82_02455 [Corynebacterium sp.]|nr:hypothetical protein [Corynebacterium sp.]